MKKNKKEFFLISGYWKDTNENFEGYKVSEYNDVIEDDNDDIFFYGLSENDIIDAITLERNTIHDFVITEYEII